MNEHSNIRMFVRTLNVRMAISNTLEHGRGLNKCIHLCFCNSLRSVKLISAINRCKKARKMLQELIGLTVFAKTPFVFCVVCN